MSSSKVDTTSGHVAGSQDYPGVERNVGLLTESNLKKFADGSAVTHYSSSPASLSRSSSRSSLSSEATSRTDALFSRNNSTSSFTSVESEASGSSGTKNSRSVKMQNAEAESHTLSMADRGLRSSMKRSDSAPQLHAGNLNSDNNVSVASSGLSARPANTRAMSETAVTPETVKAAPSKMEIKSLALKNALNKINGFLDNEKNEDTVAKEVANLFHQSDAAHAFHGGQAGFDKVSEGEIALYRTLEKSVAKSKHGDETRVDKVKIEDVQHELNTRISTTLGIDAKFVTNAHREAYLAVINSSSNHSPDSVTADHIKSGMELIRNRDSVSSEMRKDGNFNGKTADLTYLIAAKALQKNIEVYQLPRAEELPADFDPRILSGEAGRQFSLPSSLKLTPCSHLVQPERIEGQETYKILRNGLHYLKLSEDGTKVTNVADDGNCLFYAIGEGKPRLDGNAKSIGGDETVMAARNKVADYFQSNFTNYVSFLAEES